MIRRPPRSTLFPSTSSSDLIRHTVQARGALADVAQEDLRDVQVSLTAEVARAYIELRGAQEQLLVARSEEHTSELQSQSNLVCRLLLEKKNQTIIAPPRTSV